MIQKERARISEIRIAKRPAHRSIPVGTQRDPDQFWERLRAGCEAAFFASKKIISNWTLGAHSIELAEIVP
jgi:hypothetical protein